MSESEQPQTQDTNETELQKSADMMPVTESSPVIGESGEVESNDKQLIAPESKPKEYNPIGNEMSAPAPSQRVTLDPDLEAITREGDPLGMVTRYEFNSLVDIVQQMRTPAAPPPEPPPEPEPEVEQHHRGGRRR